MFVTVSLLLLIQLIYTKSVCKRNHLIQFTLIELNLGYSFQILWSGRWQSGSAAGAGEDMEQIFSYLSRWNLTTKNMLAYSKSYDNMHMQSNTHTTYVYVCRQCTVHTCGYMHMYACIVLNFNLVCKYNRITVAMHVHLMCLHYVQEYTVYAKL